MVICEVIRTQGMGKRLIILMVLIAIKYDKGGKLFTQSVLITALSMFESLIHESKVTIVAFSY